MASDNENGHVIWFLTGMALGAAVALMLAPQSGKDTRDLVKRKAQGSRDSLARSGREVADKGRELFERGKGLADEAAEAFEKGKKAVIGG